MIQARVWQGHIEVRGVIPEEWEGMSVKILPLTPDDPQPDLDERLAALHGLGPMDWELGEREAIGRMMRELDQTSREAMQQIAGQVGKLP